MYRQHQTTSGVEIIVKFFRNLKPWSPLLQAVHLYPSKRLGLGLEFGQDLGLDVAICLQKLIRGYWVDQFGFGANQPKYDDFFNRNTRTL